MKHSCCEHPAGNLTHRLGYGCAKVSLISLGFWAAIAQPARGHGARLDYQIVPSVEVQAHFDTGEPMANAQVAIFAPEQPDTPWQTGLTDEAGNFRFSPDLTQTGNWEVQVRQAGHGSMTTIPVGGEAATTGDSAAGGIFASQAVASASQGEFTPAQTLLMTGLGLWGLLGTGLYFSRRSRATPPAQPASQSEATPEPRSESSLPA